MALLSGGCATDYRMAAIKEARLYALEQFPDLNESAIHCIKYTPPEIRQKEMFHQTSKYSKPNFTQTCFVWTPPDSDGKSLVIVGFSEMRLKDWYPIRALYKRYRYIEPSTSSKKSDKK